MQPSSNSARLVREFQKPAKERGILHTLYVFFFTFLGEICLFMPLPPFINLTKTKIQIWSEINVLRFAFIFISSTPLSIPMLHVCHPPRPDKIFIRHVTFPFYCPLHSQSTQGPVQCPDPAPGHVPLSVLPVRRHQLHPGQPPQPPADGLPRRWAQPHRWPQLRCPGPCLGILGRGFRRGSEPRIGRVR